MRLSTSLPKKFDMCTKSQCVSTCHVHPVGITAVLPILSSPLLVHRTFRQEVHARGHGKSPFHVRTPEDLDTKGNHVRHGNVSLKLTAASSHELAACCALRRQENGAARALRVDERVCSRCHAQPSTTRRSPFNYRRNTVHAVESTLCMKSDRSHAIPCTSRRMTLLFLYADGKELHGCSRGGRQLSCYGRSLSRRGGSSSRREAVADVAAVSLFNTGGVRHSSHGREIQLQGVVCRAAVKCTYTRGEEAPLGIIRQDRTTSVLVPLWASRNVVGKEHWCVSRGTEEVRRSAALPQEPAIVARDVYPKSALSAQKPTTSGESHARRRALGNPQSSSRAAGGDAGLETELLKLTAEQLQHTAEQVFLWSYSAASSTTSPARGQVRAVKERSQGEEMPMRCIDLPWERVFHFLQRWTETLVRSSELVSLEFTSIPLSRSTVCPRESLSGRASGIAGKQAREVKDEAMRKEGTATHQAAACAAETATRYDSASKTSRWKGGATAEAATETTAGVNANIEGRHSDMTSDEENTHRNRAHMNKYLSRIPEKSEALQTLSFYPPLFVRKDVMSFRLPWHELRSDLPRPFFGTMQCGGNGTGEQTDVDSAIQKPRFWGRFFCLRNFSPIAKARAQLEQGVVG